MRGRFERLGGNSLTVSKGVARKTVTATVPEEARTITTATRELQLSWFANKKIFLVFIQSLHCCDVFFWYAEYFLIGYTWARHIIYILYVIHMLTNEI